MQVNLTYFNHSGKIIERGTYQTQQREIWATQDEVRNMAYTLKNLPGLTIGHDNFYILIEFPARPYRGPHLIIPPTNPHL